MRGAWRRRELVSRLNGHRKPKGGRRGGFATERRNKEGDVRRAPRKESQRPQKTGTACPDCGKKGGPPCRLRVEMICPQCNAEYRRGFSMCAGFGVPLVGATGVDALRGVVYAPEDAAHTETPSGTALTPT